LAERNRRYPKRPFLFWAVFAGVAIASLATAIGFGIHAG
jgi:hypothetical protein